MTRFVVNTFIDRATSSHVLWHKVELFLIKSTKALKQPLL